MSSVSYEVFLPHVLQYLPHCPEPQAVLAIRSTCIDYCRSTQLLQQEIDPISVSAGISEYEIDVDSGYTLDQILSLTYLTRRLERKSQMELERAYTRNWQSVGGTPQAFTVLRMGEVCLVPYPVESTTNALTGRICLAPSRSSSQTDSILYERYLDDIVLGALSRLKMTPDQPYSDLNGAVTHAAMFRAACANTRSFVNGGMNHAPMRVRFNRIF